MFFYFLFLFLVLCLFAIFSEGTRCMPRYVDASFWDRVEKGLFLGLYVGFEYICFEFRFVGAYGDDALG